MLDSLFNYDLQKNLHNRLAKIKKQKKFHGQLYMVSYMQRFDFLTLFENWNWQRLLTHYGMKSKFWSG